MDNTITNTKDKSNKSGKNERSVDKAAEKQKEKDKAKKAQSRDMPRKARGESHIESQKAIYEIFEELGQGSFGSVYKVRREVDGRCFAMKCESVHVKKQIIAHEAGVLLALNQLNSLHFVDLVDNGKVTNRFLFVVLKLVGTNLWDLRVRQPEKRYTLPSTLKIAEQTLEGLRDLHRVGYLHRDIKPPNFAIGREDEDTLHVVYVLDFGLCRRICSKGIDLRTPRTTCAFRGTTRYASMAAHEMKEQSRKDDLESWWYMIAEMICFEVPWKQMKGTDRDAVKVAKKILRDDENALRNLFKNTCYEQMKAILFYLDKLTYRSIPDYDYVYRWIEAAATANNIGPKTPVDWDKEHPYRGPLYKLGEPYIVKELL